MKPEAAIPNRKFGIHIFTIVFTLVILFVFRSFLVAIVLAIAFGIILDPAYKFIKRKLKTNRGVTATIVLLLFIIAVVFPSIFFGALIVDEAVSLARVARPWVEARLGAAGETGFAVPAWVPFHEQLTINGSEILEKFPDMAAISAEFVFNSLNRLMRGSVDAVFQFFIFTYALFFFIGRGTDVAQSLLKATPFREQERADIIKRTMITTQAIIKSVFIIGVIQGMLVALAFWAVGIERALFWGLFVAILSAIPVLGSGLVWLPAGIILIANGQPVAGIGMILWGLVVVGMVDNILRPRIVGQEAQIHDLLILLSILGGLSLFGFAGLLLGPMLIAAYLAVLDVNEDRRQAAVTPG